MFKYDNSSLTVSQLKILDAPANKTVKFSLTNALNVSAVYIMKVQFYCPVVTEAVNYTFKSPNITQSKAKVQYPAEIASISRGGLVDVRFYLAVLVPNLTHPTS